MEIFIKIAQLLLSLSILVLLHEFGHFIAAKIFKTRVEKFYLFFNPWFSLFKFKRGETTYGIGWLPLGGYVKIAGMIDESMDKEQLKKEPQPYEFRSKPAWQRLIIMVGGVTMNLILAFIIYIFLLFLYGEQYLPNSSVKYGIACEKSALDMGFQNGDKIISIDGKEIDDFSEIVEYIILGKPKVITVNRNDEIIDISVQTDIITKMIRDQDVGFITPRFPTQVVGFANESVAKEAGIEIDDKIIGVNDIHTPFFNEFRYQLQNNIESEIELHLIRGMNDTLTTMLTVPTSGLIGIQLADISNFLDLKTKEYSLLHAVPAGVVKTYSTTVLYLKQLRIIFSPKTEGYKNLGGFITIGNLFPAKWNWYAFWTLTALISIILAIMNLLPIPALDGGHVMFLLWEVITGRKPHDKFMEYAQMAGMIILLLLVLYANGMDVLRLFK
jgi:regulator of sigma E protease